MKKYSMPPELLAIKNNRQREFSRLVALEGLPAAEAYIRSGYAEQGAAQGAARLLTNVNVQSAIAALQDQAFSASVMSRAEALSILTEIGRDNKAEKPIVATKAISDLSKMEAWNKQPEPTKPDPEEGKNQILAAMRAIGNINRGFDATGKTDLSINERPKDK